MKTHNKMRNKKYHTIAAVPKVNEKITERGKILLIISIPVHDRSLSCLGTGTSTVKSGGVKPALFGQTSSLSEMMCSSKCFPYVGKMPTVRTTFL